MTGGRSPVLTRRAPRRPEFRQKRGETEQFIGPNTGRLRDWVVQRHRRIVMSSSWSRSMVGSRGRGTGDEVSRVNIVLPPSRLTEVDRDLVGRIVLALYRHPETRAASQ